MSETHTQSQSSTIQNSKDTLHIEEYVSEAINRIVEEQLRTVMKSVSATDEETERITEIFDTSQPTDSATGTPPLLGRIHERRNVSKRNETMERTEASGTATETQSVNDTTITESGHKETLEEESHEKTDAEIREKKQAPGYLTALKLICFLTVFIFFWWLSRKVIKRFSNKH